MWTLCYIQIYLLHSYEIVAHCFHNQMTFIARRSKSSCDLQYTVLHFHCLNSSGMCRPTIRGIYCVYSTLDIFNRSVKIVTGTFLNNTVRMKFICYYMTEQPGITNRFTLFPGCAMLNLGCVPTFRFHLQP